MAGEPPDLLNGGVWEPTFPNYEPRHPKIDNIDDQIPGVTEFELHLSSSKLRYALTYQTDKNWKGYDPGDYWNVSPWNG
jgi:hypothetical protein